MPSLTMRSLRPPALKNHESQEDCNPLRVQKDFGHNPYIEKLVPFRADVCATLARDMYFGFTITFSTIIPRLRFSTVASKRIQAHASTTNGVD